MVDPYTNEKKHLIRRELLHAAVGDIGMSKVNTQIIGRQETVTDATVAIDTAKKASIEVKVYENAGHMM